MKFKIANKIKSSCDKYHFNIYEHQLTMYELDDYILEILYNKDNLNYLFQLDIPLNKKDRINQLQRFIDDSFRNREHEITDKEILKVINDNKNKSYYSFFAEALLARLNINYIDSKLSTGVIKVGDNLTVTGHGADVCMYSDDNLIIGEAKFSGKLYRGTHNIISDKSFLSKFSHFISTTISNKTEIFIKGINGDITVKTKSEIEKLPITFTGFVLHTLHEDSLEYDKSYRYLEKNKIANCPSHVNVHLYHLPIESKNELIFKAQRKAINLIIEELQLS